GLERLLARVGLRHEQVLDVDADLRRVRGIHRVLGVDEGTDAAAALRLGDRVVDERGLARRLGAEDLDDAAAREAADPEREVERERAGRDRADRDGGVVVHLHDRALAELALDLPEGYVQCFVLVHLSLPRRRLRCRPSARAGHPRVRLLCRTPTLEHTLTLRWRSIPVRRTAPRRAAAVKGKQPRRTERMFPSAGRAEAPDARGSARR